MSSTPRGDNAPLLRPAEAAQRLGIPASTLRRWSRRFADFLSPQANGLRQADGGRGHRRYTPEDLAVLAQCKTLLSQGLTFEQVAQRLERDFEPEVRVVEGEIEEVEATQTQEEPPPPAGELMREEGAAEISQMIAQMLAGLSGSQQMLITAQQTERELLSVVIQDNLNLKEENKRLRERMVETERRIFEMKREMTRHREEERERMRQMEAYLFQLQRQLDDLARSQRPSAAPAAPRLTLPAGATGPAPTPAPEPLPAPNRASARETNAAASSRTSSPADTSPPKRTWLDWLFGRK